MKWFNEKSGVLAGCEQLEPVFDENSHIIRGKLNRDGTFTRDVAGRDILHRPIPGQIEVHDDDPRVQARLNPPPV